MVLEALLNSLKQGLLAKVLTDFTPHLLQASYPCPYGIKLDKRQRQNSKRKKSKAAEVQKFKEGRENQSQQLKRTMGKNV